MTRASTQLMLRLTNCASWSAPLRRPGSASSAGSSGRVSSGTADHPRRSCHRVLLVPHAQPRRRHRWREWACSALSGPTRGFTVLRCPTYPLRSLVYRAVGERTGHARSNAHSVSRFTSCVPTQFDQAPPGRTRCVATQAKLPLDRRCNGSGCVYLNRSIGGAPQPV